MRNFILFIGGLTCNNCTETVENHFKDQKIIEDIHVQYQNGKGIATIQIDEKKLIPPEITDESQKTLILQKKLKEMIEEIGFVYTDSVNMTAGCDEKAEQHLAEISEKNKIEHQKLIRNYWLKGIAGILFGLIMIGLSFTGITIPFFLMIILGGFFTVFTLWVGHETYKKAFLLLVKTKTLSMEALFTVSTLLAIVISCLSFVFPVLPMIFDAALFIIGFKNIGKAIEENLKKRITDLDFRTRIPKTIMVKDIKEEVPIKNLMPGNIIIVKKNQTVPVNGFYIGDEKTHIINYICSGNVNEISPRELIYAGSVVPDDIDFIEIEVKTIEKDSFASFSSDLIRKKQVEKQSQSIFKKAQSIAIQYLIPTLFTIAIISGILVSVFISPIAAILTVLTILVSVCPCVFGLINPLAAHVAKAKAEEQGIHLNHSQAIEKISEFKKGDIFCFDATGTLTSGKPKVSYASDMSPEQLSLLAKIESYSKHAFAQAIIKHIQTKEIKQYEDKILGVDTSSHKGIKTTINNQVYLIGNREMMEKNGIDISRYEKKIEEKSDVIQFTVYFASQTDNTVLGHFIIEESLRPHAKETIAELQRQGKIIHLATGADEEDAKMIAKKLNIPQTNIAANLFGEYEFVPITDNLPTENQFCLAKSENGSLKYQVLSQNGNIIESTIDQDELKNKFQDRYDNFAKACESEDRINELKPYLYDILTITKQRKHTVVTKSSYIQSKQSSGKNVAFIGDGGNDCIPLIEANIGIAMRESNSSDEVTQKNADVVIDGDSLWSVIKLLAIGKQYSNNITQNLTISFSYNFLVMIAFSGLLGILIMPINPFIGGLLMMPALGALLMILQSGLVFMNLERFKRQSLPQAPSQAGINLANIQKKLGIQPQQQLEPPKIPQESSSFVANWARRFRSIVYKDYNLTNESVAFGYRKKT